jgi:Protein of unknown function (DUF3060)
MPREDDPEERIRELERPLAETARASESASAGPAGQGYHVPHQVPHQVPPPPPPPTPWTYGGTPFPGPPQRTSGNRTWWILGTVVVVGTLALVGGIAAVASHQFSGVRSIIESPPTTTGDMSSTPSVPGPSSSRTKTTRPSPSPSASPSTSPAPPPGGSLSVSGINENRTITCNDNNVSVSGVSNTVVITGHCTRLSVSGMQNAITVDAVDTIDASGFDNKVTYHSGVPKISNSGGSNVVEKG